AVHRRTRRLLGDRPDARPRADVDLVPPQGLGRASHHHPGGLRARRRGLIAMSAARIAAAAAVALALAVVLSRPALADPVTGAVTSPTDDASYESPLRAVPAVTGSFDH